MRDGWDSAAGPPKEISNPSRFFRAGPLVNFDASRQFSRESGSRAVRIVESEKYCSIKSTYDGIFKRSLSLDSVQSELIVR